MIYLIEIYDFFIDKYFITHGWVMDFLDRLRLKIIKNYPGITEEELADRMLVAKHLIALEHRTKLLLNEKASCQTH